MCTKNLLGMWLWKLRTFAAKLENSDELMRTRKRTSDPSQQSQCPFKTCSRVFTKHQSIIGWSSAKMTKVARQVKVHIFIETSKYYFLSKNWNLSRVLIYSKAALWLRQCLVYIAILLQQISKAVRCCTLHTTAWEVSTALLQGALYCAVSLYVH